MSIESIGANIIQEVKNSTGAFNLLVEAGGSATSLIKPPVRKILYKQVYFTGIEALNKIAILAVLIGLVIITQIVNIVGPQPLLIGKILLWTVVRELGPLFGAIIIIARSCTAIASELGSMKVHREVESLRIMGIDPVAYLIVPRILAVTISLFILTFYFQVISIVGGLALSSFFMDVSFMNHLEVIFSSLGFSDIIATLLKSITFGVAISTISCYHGLRASGSITEVPQMTTVAVMQSLFAVIILDGIVTLVFFS